MKPIPKAKSDFNSAAQNEVCLARQPIIDENCDVVAYELLFRQPGAKTASVTDNSLATISVITNAFTNMGARTVFGDKLAFINFDAKALKSDMIEMLPQDSVVIEILETVQGEDELIEQIKKLRQKNYQFALDDFVYREDLDKLMPFVDIIKVDITLLNQAKLVKYVEFGKARNKRLLAEKVETPNQFEMCKALGFSLFQGYFLAKPTNLVQKDIPASKLRIIQIMNQIMEDVDSAELERVISHDLALSYKLLKFVNSVGRSCGKELCYVGEAISMLGRNALYRWLSLLLFTSLEGEANAGNALFNMAFYRGRLLEILGGLRKRENTNELFVLGTFSYLEALLNRRLDLILKDMVIPTYIKQALLQHEGPYWPYLKLVESIDNGETKGLADCANQLDLSFDDITQAQLTATADFEAIN